MANRAAKIAGQMLSRRDAKGNAKPPASPEEVVAALERAWTPIVVVREWENEARRRHGGPTRVQMIGHDYRKRNTPLRRSTTELADAAWLKKCRKRRSQRHARATTRAA